MGPLLGVELGSPVGNSDGNIDMVALAEGVSVATVGAVEGSSDGKAVVITEGDVLGNKEGDSDGV